MNKGSSAVMDFCPLFLRVEFLTDTSLNRWHVGQVLEGRGQHDRHASAHQLGRETQNH